MTLALHCIFLISLMTLQGKIRHQRDVPGSMELGQQKPLWLWISGLQELELCFYLALQLSVTRGVMLLRPPEIRVSLNFVGGVLS